MLATYRSSIEVLCNLFIDQIFAKINSSKLPEKKHSFVLK